MAASDETSVALTRGLPPALHYGLEQVSKIDILRKLKQRFGGKPSATSVFVWGERRAAPSLFCFTRQSIFC
jgi:hypothetical protein